MVPVVVEMPSSGQVLSSLVRHILTKQTTGFIPYQQVFLCLEYALFTRNVTLSRFVRILVYIFHFMKQLLSKIIACPYNKHPWIAKSMKHLRCNEMTNSRNKDAQRPCPCRNAATEQKVNERAGELQMWKHGWRSIENLFWELRGGNSEPCKNKKKQLRTLMFKAFLPTSDGVRLKTTRGTRYIWRDCKGPTAPDAHRARPKAIYDR